MVVEESKGGERKRAIEWKGKESKEREKRLRMREKVNLRV